MIDNLKAEIDKLPRIKIGNSNSPTVKYCIDEVLLYDLLDNLPCAEKTAEWIYRGNSIICSNCGDKIPYGIHNYYCRNCGAKMKGLEG